MYQAYSFLLMGALLLAGVGCAFKAEEASWRKKTSFTGQEATSRQVQRHAVAAAAFIKQHRYNTHLCFLVDMSLPSGGNRFFVYNLEKDTVEAAGVVAHGRCNENWLKGRKYSNVNGSGCTSLGRYKVGKPYTGRFGLAYKLYGLDATNSNAFERYVVLHSHECVPLSEISPDEICQSDGCPTVAPAFLVKLARKLDRSSAPVLLWIYE
jgi:hypothetical protein